MKRIAGILLAVCTVFLTAVQTAFSAPSQSDWEVSAGECLRYFTEQSGMEDFWTAAEQGISDWAAYCYARLYGAQGAEKYAASLERRAEELSDGGGFVPPTEYQRIAICVSAAGGDASRAAELGAYRCETLDRQGLNAYIWALIAVNATGIAAPEDAVNTSAELSEYIISKQHPDGSFSLMGDSGDVDITAAAVYALAGTDLLAAQEAAALGADWLCGFESYSSMGVRNCESTAQAVIALCAAGRYENAVSAASQLEEYRIGGGYSHLPGGKADRLATTQALEAFTALALAERGVSLFGEYPSGTSGIAEIAPGSAEQPSANTQENKPVIPPSPDSAKLTGTHIRIIISAVPGTAAVVCIVLFVLRRRKALIPAAILLAAVSGGVWLLDIRTPEEYYAGAGGGPLSVTVSADCSAVLSRMGDNDPGVIPEDGVVIERCEVSLPEGASAFDALTAAAREQRVRVDYTGSTYGVYIRSVGYICEFDFGELSGWLYRVNGVFPDVSASEYKLSPGDIVEFVYSCDLGRDVGDDCYPD